MLADNEPSCYTNHALDQFLEHLVEVGMEKIIRIGGRSRSEVLNGKNLRVVSKEESKTRSESYDIAMGYKALEDKEKMIKKTLGILYKVHQQPRWTTVQPYLARRHQAIHSQFSRVDEEGFESVGRDPFDIWLSQKSDVPPQEPSVSIDSLVLAATRDAHSILPVHRKLLVAHWVEEICDDATDNLFESVKEATITHNHRTAVHDDIDRRVLQTADVIGVTTTGLAKRIATLQHVKSKVVICEEAGEVLEPHILSALLPSVEHFIQIGDHQQLRPQINNYRLSIESKQGALYQLDRSQFERLASANGKCARAPVAQLNVQRRMRPEISSLIRQTLYPKLRDHDSTKGLPNVVGMRRNVVWLDHDHLQDGPTGDKHMKSHSNVWEVDMVHTLVRHLVRQGVYKSTDIAVLTPYTGQLQKLRHKMRNDFEVVLSDRDQETLRRDGFETEEIDLQSQVPSGYTPLAKKQMSELLRMATVDNFQGEEAKVVIVSLVRSNKEKKVGFLRTSNRINVLLSRAQHGMYLLGNAETYSSQPMWEQILAMLEAKSAVGKFFDLCCPRHTDTEMQASEPEDFARLSPEGGCQLACDQRLDDCGHRCQARCHSDSMHRAFSCPQPCQRLLSPCGHSCQKATCGEDCGLCKIPIEDVELPCGHRKARLPCHQTRDLENVKCVSWVVKEVPECKHSISVQCYRDVGLKNFRCPSPCTQLLGCGHQCSGTCGKCRQMHDEDRWEVKHLPCTKVCGRRFGTCNHTCTRLCHHDTACGPCPAPCEVSTSFLNIFQTDFPPIFNA